MTTGTISVNTSENDSDTVIGPGNFNAYFDLSAIGDATVEINRFVDVAGTASPLVDGPVEVTFGDVSDGGTLIDIIPFSLQANQTARISIKKISGSDFSADWRITNLLTNT